MVFLGALLCRDLSARAGLVWAKRGTIKRQLGPKCLHAASARRPVMSWGPAAWRLICGYSRENRCLPGSGS